MRDVVVFGRSTVFEFVEARGLEVRVGDSCVFAIRKFPASTFLTILVSNMADKNGTQMTFSFTVGYGTVDTWY
jgi:hypothetical protein